MNMSYGYLINADYVKLFGLPMNDIALIIDIIICLIITLGIRNKKSPNYNFKFWCISFLFLVIFSSYQALSLYGQPFVYGFRAQRTLFVFLLLYFPLYKCYYNNIITKNDILNAIKTVVVVELILFIIQFFIADKILFLHVYIGQRYGDLRFYVNPLLFILLYIIELNDIINNKMSFKKILLMVLIIFEIVVVQKFRLTFIALYITTFLSVLFSKISFNKKMIFVSIVIVFIFCFIFFTSMGKDLLNTILDSNITTSSTMSIRNEGKKYYLNFLKEHPILGAGYPNISSYAPAAEVTGKAYKFYLGDNGVFGFAFIYGIVGLSWLISLFFYFIKHGLNILKTNNNIIYIMFPIFLILTSINEIHWYWDIGPVIFAIFIILFNLEISKVEGEKNDKTKIN